MKNLNNTGNAGGKKANSNYGNAGSNTNIFETNDSVRKLYRKKEKIKYFKVFRAVMIFVAVVCMLYAGLAVIYLQNWNIEQLLSITN